MKNGLPETLQEAIVYFADPDVAHEFAASLRWPAGPVCPRCESKAHSYLRSRRVYKCKSCQKQYSVKVGTIFEDSPISLDKWLAAVWMLANAKNGVSSYEIARALGLTQKSAWFMLHRIRLAMKAKSFDKKLAGTVEADETFIGGALKNMHESKKRKKGYVKKSGKSNAGPLYGKVIVSGVLERDGEVRAEILKELGSWDRLQLIMDNVEHGSNVMTDEGYAKLGAERYIHEFINHEREYVRGNIHTNGIENFWSLLKRTLHGTYVAVEPFHLSAYVDEQCFRFNKRKAPDAERMDKAMEGIAGRRLTYKKLIQAEQA